MLGNTMIAASTGLPCTLLDYIHVLCILLLLVITKMCYLLAARLLANVGLVAHRSRENGSTPVEPPACSLAAWHLCFSKLHCDMFQP